MFAGAVSQHECASAFASHTSCCFSLDPSLEEKLELVDTFGKPENDVATSKLDRAEACLCLGTAVYLHGVSIYNSLATTTFKMVSRICAGYGLLRATAEGSVSPLTVWSNVYDIIPSNADRVCFVLMIANKHSIIAKVLQAWHGGRRSQHERPPGPDQMQVQDSRLQSHILQANGTLTRIARNIHLDKLHPNAAKAHSQRKTVGNFTRADTTVSTNMPTPRSPIRYSANNSPLPACY